jgi:eukaryotic-like serine/threonine-protein kinase
MSHGDADTLLAESESESALATQVETSSMDTALDHSAHGSERRPRTTSPAVDVERGTLSLTDGVRYAPREVLGQGGMGTVDLSADRLIGRDVAVKTLRPQLADDPRVLARFLREARIQGQLEHPAIVPVYDLGRTETGELYFAMKRVKGRTLREILAADRPKPEGGVGEGVGEDPRFGRRRLLSAFSQICQAVAFAHSRGVVHRDLKPDNLMFGEHGEVYVLDWGIAKLRDQGREADEDDALALELGADGEQTRHGAIIGTVGYMSPEQAGGEQARVDARSDVWSLGAILYEILARRPLIPSGSTIEMLSATILGVEGDPSRVDPELPPELARVCVAATATERDARLSSAQALSEAIERFLDGDRDAQMRRVKAEEHAEAAAHAAARAFESDDLELRRAAARESGVALALDPDNVDARRTLLELLTRPPAQLPAGARARLDEDHCRTLRSFYRASLTALALYLPLMLVFPFVELREAWVVPSLMLCGLVFVGLCVAGLRDTRADTRLPLGLHIATCFGMLVFARFVTPLLIVPALVMNTMVTLPYRSGTPRWAFVAVGVCAVLIPAALEFAGIWPSTMAFEGGVLRLRSAMVEIGDSPWVIPGLLMMSVFPMVVGNPQIGRVQQLSEDIARAAHIQRWQLEQLTGYEPRQAP